MQKYSTYIVFFILGLLLPFTQVIAINSIFGQLNNSTGGTPTSNLSNDTITELEPLEITNAPEGLENETTKHSGQTSGQEDNQTVQKQDRFESRIVPTNTITSIDSPFFNAIDTSYPIKVQPENGSLSGGLASGQAPNFRYQSDSNFTGKDMFVIEKRNPSNNELYGNVTFNLSVHERSISVPLFWDKDPVARSTVALLISAISTLVIFIVVWAIVKKFKGRSYKIYFSDIVRTSDWDPSLSIFQFLIWTGVIIFSFLGLYLVRIFSGVTDFVAEGIPLSVLGLMGISVGVPLLSKYLTNSKKGPGTLTDSPPPEPRPGLSLMLYENNQPSLSRFQLFAWTWIGVIIYLCVLFSQINTHMSATQNLLLPDIDPTLLALMGLSNFAFLGAKAQNSKMQITSIFPEEKVDRMDSQIQSLTNRMKLPPNGHVTIGKQNIGETISIFGTNFAHQRDKVWFDETAFPFEGLDIKNEITWQPTGDRIDLIIPEQLEPKLYLVRVANGGFLSDPYILRILPKRS